MAKKPGHRLTPFLSPAGSTVLPGRRMHSHAEEPEPSPPVPLKTAKSQARSSVQQWRTGPSSESISPEKLSSSGGSAGNPVSLGQHQQTGPEAEAGGLRQHSQEQHPGEKQG